MKNKILLPLVLLLSISLVGCSGKKEYKDGVYKATVDNRGSGSTILGVATAIVEIKDGKIVKVDYQAQNAKGEVKDENYGKSAGEVNYKKAQKALAGIKKYPQLLIEKQDIDDVDVVSGSTISHKEFVEVIKKALEKGEK